MSWLVPHLLLAVGYALAVTALIYMLRQRRSAPETIAWLLAFVLLPYVGVVLYLLTAGRQIRRAIATESLLLPTLPHTPGDDGNGMEKLMCGLGLPATVAGNRLHFQTTAVQGFNALRDLFNGATHTLHVTTFVFGADPVARELLGCLVQRARDGVEVRVLIDAMGSFKTPGRFFAPLVQAGGQYAYFRPVFHIPFVKRTNLRNHRKIAVADGRRVMAGGMNITAVEMHPQERPDTWRGLAFTAEGAAAALYDRIFASDWAYATGEQLAVADIESTGADGTSRVQVVPSGPDVSGDPLFAATISATYRASNRLWIVTPYFVPNEELLRALLSAVCRGVDVRLIVPERSNHPLSDFVGAGARRALQTAGAQVRLYTAGMVHAKAMLVDDSIAMVGSANLDMRSLFLNYEVMQFHYSPADIAELASWFTTLEGATRIDRREPGLVRRLIEGAGRVLSPLL